VTPIGKLFAQAGRHEVADRNADSNRSNPDCCSHPATIDRSRLTYIGEHRAFCSHTFIRGLFAEPGPVFIVPFDPPADDALQALP
jgi:hypothetical protein